MKAVVQRVSEASVAVNGEVVGAIGTGFVVLLGVGANDTEQEADYLVRKIAGLRVFEDANDKMNLSIADIDGEILVISQFTLYADMRKGRRPSFTNAAPPDLADELYQYFCGSLIDTGLRVETGQFQAHMMVSLVNDGPVTLILDTDELMKKR